MREEDNPGECRLLETRRRCLKEEQGTPVPRAAAGSASPEAKQGLLHLVRWTSGAGAVERGPWKWVRGRAERLLGASNGQGEKAQEPMPGAGGREEGYHLKGTAVQCGQMKGFWTVVPEQHGCAHYRNAHLQMLQMARFTCV